MVVEENKPGEIHVLINIKYVMVFGPGLVFLNIVRCQIILLCDYV